MKTYIVSNGTTSIAIVPETEVEKLQLMEVFKAGTDLDVRVEDKVQILNRSLSDVVILTTKQKEP